MKWHNKIAQGFSPALALGSGTKDRALPVRRSFGNVGRRRESGARVPSGYTRGRPFRTAIRIDPVPLQRPYPLRGCNSDLAQYSNTSNTPSLRTAGFEDEDDDEDENEAPGEGGDDFSARIRQEQQDPESISIVIRDVPFAPERFSPSTTTRYRPLHHSRGKNEATKTW